MKKITLLSTAFCLALAIQGAKAQTTPPEPGNPTSTGIRTGPTNTDPRPAQTNAPSLIKPENNPNDNPHNTGTNTSSAGSGRMPAGSTLKLDKKGRDTTVAKP
ncbi:MAG: hypothetical protein EOP47_13495 [Sphingobacteriaceae bacterium]|nr:MAG: hypothetical protein EOP47_13495 [Sphingobacteriaceae bacterium]